LFEADMEYLKAKGYTTVSAAEILDYVDGGAPLPEKPVLVTFDDGFYSVRHYLLPIMERLGVKAVMNVEGSFADHASANPVDRDNPNYSYLTWEEICGLKNSGLFEIGNHSYDMHHARGKRIGCKIRSGESCEAYREALTEDIGKLQDKLQETCGARALVFAYPFGSISEESYSVLEDMGFRILLTCYGMPNYLKADPGATLVLNRWNRSGSLSTEKFMARLLKG
ncbi:MAG: polysaccharide deacetylase family protein, partial [Firmicutes bacterium]|nr:polysaccharide deacetylase family protein [Bacillota bacterium]